MRRLLLLTTLVLLSIAVMAPTANAGLLVQSAPRCAPQPLSQPFKQFGDSAYYTLLKGGSFENGTAGWSLRGASVVSDNESFFVNGKNDSRALRISAGGVVTSPTICAGLEHPTMRFFAKSSGLLPVASVSVLTETSLGLVAEVPLGVITPGSKWHPTPSYLVVANLLPLLPGDHTPLAFRFRAVTGTWTIDDVYVDPMRRS